MMGEHLNIQVKGMLQNVKAQLGDDDYDAEIQALKLFRCFSFED